MLITHLPDPQCNAFAKNMKLSTWKLRVSLPVYTMAIQSLLGWLLFLVFAGVGLLAAPIDWLQEFLGRPRATITKSEYMRRAQILAQRAKQILVRRWSRGRNEWVDGTEGYYTLGEVPCPRCFGLQPKLKHHAMTMHQMLGCNPKRRGMEEREE